MKYYKVSVSLLLITLLISVMSCYRAGNAQGLDYPVHTPLRTGVVRMYVDSLIKDYGYAVPEKWMDNDKLVDLDSVNFKRIYFKYNPEEMYLLSYGGMLSIVDVYNPQIIENSWIRDREIVSEEENKRIMTRFKVEILDKVEAMAKEDGLSDSIIYLNY